MSVFDAWWEHAREHYFSWDGDKPTGCDLYYDPVIDHHHGHSPFGITLPAWYLAPIRRDIARAGWEFVAGFSGASSGGPIQVLPNPQAALVLLQLGGEFAEGHVRAQLWDAAGPLLEPTWNNGELTYRFGLDEPHPRGQLNARAAAAAACTTGAWNRIFNEPNLAKFDQPTVVGVDFPNVVLKAAAWDGSALTVAATSLSGGPTRFRVTNVPESDGWVLARPGATPVPLASDGREVVVELVADGTEAVIART